MHHGQGRSRLTLMRSILALMLLSFCVACDRSTSRPSTGDRSPLDNTQETQTDSLKLHGVPATVDASGNWTRPALDFASTRFSPLDQITVGSVKHLGVKSTFSTGYLRGHEAAPLVVSGTMFVVTPFPNVVYALDLTQPGIPTKWTYHSKTLGAAQGVACCDVVNRGAPYSTDGDDLLQHARQPHHRGRGSDRTGAMGRDARRHQHAARRSRWRPSSSNGKVLVGNSGGEMGVRGWLTALDAATGQIAWRAYSTGPDKDVLIGPRFKPFYGHLTGTGSRRPHVAGRGVETGRRHRVGLDVVRSRLESRLRTALAILGPGMRNSDQATTSGPRESSPATPIPARQSGSTRRPPTTSSITTTSTRRSSLISAWTVRHARCCCVQIVTATCT